MDAVEAIGLVKMDILAQGGLAAMRDVKTELYWGAGNRELNLKGLEPWQDPQVCQRIPRPSR